MFLDADTDVALVEQDRGIVAAKQRIAQPGFEAVPAGGERAGELADVLVVHQKQRADAVRLHPLARAFEPVLAQPVPIHTLLPI